MQSTQGSQWPSPLWFCLSLLVKGSPGRLCAAGSVLPCGLQ